jgi:transposase
MNDKELRRRFTDDFKRDAVKLVIEQGYNTSEASRRLGVSQSNISRWVRQYRQSTENPSGTDRELEAENKRLRKENQRLLMEREILKKAAAFFASESK